MKTFDFDITVSTHYTGRKIAWPNTGPSGKCLTPIERAHRLEIMALAYGTTIQHDSFIYI